MYWPIVLQAVNRFDWYLQKYDGTRSLPNTPDLYYSTSTTARVRRLQVEPLLVWVSVHCEGSKCDYRVPHHHALVYLGYILEDVSSMNDECNAIDNEYKYRKLYARIQVRIRTHCRSAWNYSLPALPQSFITLVFVVHYSISTQINFFF